jgi:hypothetical protein
LGNDYRRRHWFVERQLDFNSTDGSTRRGTGFRAPRVAYGALLRRLGPVAQPSRARRRGALSSEAHNPRWVIPFYRADRQRGGRENVVHKSKSHSEAVSGGA